VSSIDAAVYWIGEEQVYSSVVEQVHSTEEVQVCSNAADWVGSSCVVVPVYLIEEEQVC